jgi:DNA polymerase III gamma/tau subunit
VGCKLRDIQEIDAATNTGIDDMRNVTSALIYKPLTGTVKALLVDEVHALSAQAWKSLLKVLEEPPDWVYWFLCTTEPMKVPETVKTRCTKYELKTIPGPQLYDFLLEVAQAENMLLSPEGKKIIDLCAKEANGSPRQALANLATCEAAKTRAEAATLLKSAVDSVEAVELAKALMAGAPWDQLLRLVKGLEEVNPESVRHVIRGYITKVILGSDSERVAGKGLEILDVFSQPLPSSDNITPILLAVGKLKLT